MRHSLEKVVILGKSQELLSAAAGNGGIRFGGWAFGSQFGLVGHATLCGLAHVTCKPHTQNVAFSLSPPVKSD